MQTQNKFSFGGITRNSAMNSLAMNNPQAQMLLMMMQQLMSGGMQQQFGFQGSSGYRGKNYGGGY